MASFLTDLWTSIFTPGPTPTLLIATNATFALLQILLFALLVATYSIHFLILSLLCAGLWVSINWFAREVLVAQAEAEREKARIETKEGKASGEGDKEVETETEKEGSVTPGARGRATGVEGVQARSRVEVSTDGEWEKVERER